MGFLLRMAFWFSLVLLVIPLDAGSDLPAEQRVGPIETFLAAREALVDLTGLCDRKPEVCEVGRSAMTVVGIRAREAARLAYEALDANLGGEEDVAATGGIAGIIEDAEQPAPELPGS